MCRIQIICRIQTYTIQIGGGPPEPMYMWNVCVGFRVYVGFKRIGFRLGVVQDVDYVQD